MKLISHGMMSLVQTSTMDIQFSVFVLLIIGLHIVTYNANGLLDHHKWKEVFALAKTKTWTFLFLQETHIHCNKVTLEFNHDLGKGFWSIGVSPQSCGVGILFNTQLDYMVHHFYYDPVGHCLVLDVSIWEKALQLINIYVLKGTKNRLLLVALIFVIIPRCIPRFLRY